MISSELKNMIKIPSGKFLMGSENYPKEKKPVHEVTVDGFYIDKYEVTNADYKKFSDETGYITVAERPLDPEEYPTVDPKDLIPGALVFKRTQGPVDLSDYFNWWMWVPGACWKNPKGPAKFGKWKRGSSESVILLMKTPRLMRTGSARNCQKQKPNGNLLQEADWKEGIIHGEMKTWSTQSQWRTAGRESFHGRI